MSRGVCCEETNFPFGLCGRYIGLQNVNLVKLWTPERRVSWQLREGAVWALRLLLGEWSACRYMCGEEFILEIRILGVCSLNVISINSFFIIHKKKKKSNTNGLQS